MIDSDMSVQTRTLRCLIDELINAELGDNITSEEVTTIFLGLLVEKVVHSDFLSANVAFKFDVSCSEVI